MREPTIVQLDAQRPDVAEHIQCIMAAAYRVEADLLGVADFAPLRRTAAQIAAARSTFIGAFRDEQLAAVTEVETAPDRPVNIASLVVSPEHIRNGLGTALTQHIIDRHPGTSITVSTGAANRPAIELYSKLSFLEHRRWKTDDGIPMVTLVRSGSPPNGPPSAR